jgi:hypothetical protein
MMRSVAKFYYLGQGKKAGHYIGKKDVRCYRPPLGYSATAELLDIHPRTTMNTVDQENGGSKVTGNLARARSPL